MAASSSRGPGSPIISCSPTRSAMSFTVPILVGTASKDVNVRTTQNVRCRNFKTVAGLTLGSREIFFPRAPSRGNTNFFEIAPGLARVLLPTALARASAGPERSHARTYERGHDMTESSWNPWKMTTIGLLLVMGPALITGRVVANRPGSSDPEKIARVEPQPAPAPVAAVQPAPPPPPAVAPAAPRPAAAPHHPKVPSQAVIETCNNAPPTSPH